MNFCRVEPVKLNFHGVVLIIGRFQILWNSCSTFSRRMESFSSRKSKGALNEFEKAVFPLEAA